MLLNDDEKEQYEENFTEDDGTLPEKIEGEKFYSAITRIVGGTGAVREFLCKVSASRYCVSRRPRVCFRTSKGGENQARSEKETK